MKHRIGAALAVTALSLGMPLAASADSSPPINQVIVQQALNQQMQTQLQTQQIQLQSQQDAVRATLNAQLQAELNQLQLLQLQQQLQLTNQRITQSASAKHSGKRRP